jgi:uncharacterized protein (TIGR02996 family)
VISQKHALKESTITHPEYLALMRTVASRNDDISRLVVADWLDEHDEPEAAEYCRVLVEVSRLIAAGHTWKSNPELARLGKLLEETERSWHS